MISRGFTSGGQWLAGCLLCAGLNLSLPAHSFESSSFETEINLELQVYTQDAAHSAQKDFYSGLTLQTQWYGEWDDGNQSLTVTPYGRFDADGSGRSHADFRELNWLGVFGSWEVLIGASRVFWGKTELLHLVDIINQTDGLENLDGEDKLGQPMLKTTWTTGTGNLQLFVLPWFRERLHVNEKGRFRSEPVVRDSRAMYQSGAEERHVDAAIRWEGWWDAVDYGVAYFEGTQRNPKFFPDALPPTGLIPFYGQLKQFSIDAQYTAEGWLWKLEAVYRKEDNSALAVTLPGVTAVTPATAAILQGFGGLGVSPGSSFGGAPVVSFVEDQPEFAAATGGFEYSFYGVFGTGMDLGVVGEYMWDGRGKDAETLFQDDFFIALRLAGNDINDNALLAGVVVDLEYKSRFFSAEYSRRIGNSMKLSLEARVLDHVATEDRFAAVIERDDLIQFTLTRFF